MLYNDFYGDNARWFIARVVDNFDPELRGRVKISIKGIHSDKQSDIPIAGLPWAETMLPATEGGTSGIGKIAQLWPNALVFGVFLDGQQSQLPLVLGHLNQKELPAPAQEIAPSSTGTSSGSAASQVGPDGTVISNKTIDAGSTDSRDSRRWATVNFFVENGFSPIQAAGIAGNLEKESGFNPTIVSNIKDKNGNRTSERSQGIAQWNPDAGRLQQLKAFASNTNRDWADFNTQLLFLMHEFKGRPTGPNDGASGTNAGYKQLLRATKFNGGQPPAGQEKNSTNATYIFHRYHSGGGNPPRSWIEATLSDREKYASKAYNQYVNTVKQDEPVSKPAYNDDDIKRVEDRRLFNETFGDSPELTSDQISKLTDSQRKYAKDQGYI